MCLRITEFVLRRSSMALLPQGSFMLRPFSISSIQQQQQEEAADTTELDAGEANSVTEKSAKQQQRRIVDVHTSMRYLQSKAYQITYGESLVWQPYRRNHKGLIPPEKTRKMCIRGGFMSTGNPCPICRDEYLVLHPENVDLLKQFISPYTGQVESYSKTGLCQKQHKKLLIVVQQAWDLGLIDMPLTFRQYDYLEYYPQLQQTCNPSTEN